MTTTSRLRASLSSTPRRSACRSARSFVSAIGAAALLAALGCGGDDGGGPVDDVDCGFAEDRYFPFAPGYTWTFQVTDLGTGIRTTKEQHISPDLVTDDEDFPDRDLLEQVTEKSTGTAISLFDFEGEALARFKQIDLDGAGNYERDTIYEPFKLRLDESAERIGEGVTYDQSFTETKTEVDMTQTVTEVAESWEVIGIDVPCSAPIGELECLQVRRTRTIGGTATKDFYFAPGIGKVREEGPSQLEELTDCGTL